jgi:hypothetical protein
MKDEMKYEVKSKSFEGFEDEVCSALPGKQHPPEDRAHSRRAIDGVRAHAGND